jgi:hypothetical protein
MNTRGSSTSPTRRRANDVQGCSLTREDIDVWATKLIWLWNPTRLIETRQREGNLGILFIAELNPSLCLHLGIGRQGVDFCAIWRGEQCVVWDDHIGFCSMWPPVPTQELADDFNSQMRPLIRRNCFLMGAQLEATPDERHQWIQWLSARTQETHIR